MLALLSCLAACSGYDATLLRWPVACGNGKLDPGEMCDVGIADPLPGACPERCAMEDRCAPASLIGSGCQRHCMQHSIHEPHDGDQCCPQGATRAEDDDCATCGDGVVGPGETCDPPDRCLTAQNCSSPDPCIIATLSGDPATCNSRCELTPVTECSSGDRCCPARCGQKNDSDCSAHCGDGVVDARVETCDRSSEVQPCVGDCDDHDPCTEDLQIGSAENCNLSCTHMRIAVPRDGDGCCPPDANAVNDRDCDARCGNGVREPGEDCDGNAQCNDRCTLPRPSACRDALASNDMGDACTRCACEACIDRVLACNASGDAEADAACQTVAACSRRTGCTTATCYCGTSLACSAPNGPCKAEIEAAARSTVPARIFACGANSSCPPTRALAQDSCLQLNCAAVCAQSVDHATD